MEETCVLKEISATIVPALPGFCSVDYDLETDDLRKTPIVAWRVTNYKDPSQPRLVIAPHCEGITADPSDDAWCVLTPDGQVIDTNVPCTWKTIEEFIEAMRDGGADEPSGGGEPAGRKRPCHLRLVREPDGAAT
jgi:hypothetical protein